MKLPGNALDPSTPVAVLGAGTMGVGIASVAVAAGHPVLLYDAVDGAVPRALARLEGDFEGLVAKGRISEGERAARLARLSPASRVGELAAAGLVIEAVVERLSAKTELLGAVERLVSQDAILTTNTSSISVTAIAAQMTRPERVVGMHFFNPAPILPLVEVVSGHLSDEDVVRTVKATAEAWGKTAVVCRSTPGFIVNRVARPYYGEALQVLAEGAADPATIDAVLRMAGGFRMGPFELMDLIGNDVNYAVTESVWSAMHFDARYRPSLLQKSLVEAGLLGRKSGRGFYSYGEGGGQGRQPQVARAAAAPRTIAIKGDPGLLAPLVEMAPRAGIAFGTQPLAAPTNVSGIEVDGVVLALSDGRTATTRTADSSRPVVLIDLALDFAKADLVAVCAPDQLPRSALDPVVGFLQALQKRVAIVDDTPGLIVARTVAMLANEAIDAAHQRIGAAEEIDLAMTKGVNYPLGPIAWARAVGPRWIATVIEHLAQAYGDNRYRVSPLLRRWVAAGQEAPIVGGMRS